MKRLSAAACAISSLGLALFSLGCTHVRQPATPSLDSLIAVLAKPVADICARAPALCEKACADCPDVDACRKANGNCAEVQTYFNDLGDGGRNPFVAGCHMYYSDPICTVNGSFLGGDSCAGDILFEWWQVDCHPVMNDQVQIDCRQLCKRMGRPGGTCESVLKVCLNEEPSARCICDPVVESIQP